MAASNAERQAAYRARCKAELEALRNGVTGECSEPPGMYESKRQAKPVPDGKINTMSRRKAYSWEFSTSRGEYTIDLHDLLNAIRFHVTQLEREGKKNMATMSPTGVASDTSLMLKAIYELAKQSEFVTPSRNSDECEVLRNELKNTKQLLRLEKHKNRVIESLRNEIDGLNAKLKRVKELNAATVDEWLPGEIKKAQAKAKAAETRARNVTLKKGQMGKDNIRRIQNILHPDRAPDGQVDKYTVALAAFNRAVT